MHLVMMAVRRHAVGKKRLFARICGLKASVRLERVLRQVSGICAGKTFAAKTFAAKTFAGKTFAGKTFAGKTFAVKTVDKNQRC